MLPLKLFAHGKLPAQAPTRAPHMPAVPVSKRGRGRRCGEAELRRVEERGVDKRGQQGRGPAPEVEGVSRRASRSPAPAHSLGGVGRNARGAGRAAQPERLRKGASQRRRRGDSGQLLEVGEGVPPLGPQRGR